MDYEVHFVHAPSASGKTTFLKTGKAGPLTIMRDQDHVIEDVLYRHGNCGIVDGDDIIHYTIGWPLNKAWFKDRDATYTHAAQLFALVNTALRIKAPPWMSDFIIMFNGGMKKLAVAEKLYAVERGGDNPVKLHHHFMIPSRADHERNIESRRQENLKEGRSWTFPANWGDAHNNRESVAKLADHLGGPVMDSFDSVLNAIKPGYKDKAAEDPIDENEYREQGRREDPSPVPAVFYDFGVCGVKVSTSSDPDRGEAHGFEFYHPPPDKSYWWYNYDIEDFGFVQKVEVPKAKTSYQIERTGFERNPVIHIDGSESMCEFVEEFKSKSRETIILKVDLTGDN